MVSVPGFPPGGRNEGFSPFVEDTSCGYECAYSITGSQAGYTQVSGCNVNKQGDEAAYDRGRKVDR